MSHNREMKIKWCKFEMFTFTGPKKDVPYNWLMLLYIVEQLACMGYDLGYSIVVSPTDGE